MPMEAASLEAVFLCDESLTTYHFIDITQLERQESKNGPWSRIDAALHHDKYTKNKYAETRELGSA